MHDSDSDSDCDFDVCLARLAGTLGEVATLLRDHGETHWLKWATTCCDELGKYNAAALDRVLGAFGGMGSLNDLLVLRCNGHIVEPEQESAVNHRLGDLRAAIWSDATALRKDLRASS